MLPGLAPSTIFNFGFPSIQGTAVFGIDSGTSHSVTLPSNIVGGELLLMHASVFGASGTITTPAGWTSLYSVASGSERLVCFYRTADGTEGATVSVTTSNDSLTAVTDRIARWSGTPEAGTALGNSGTNGDPPNVAPSWGSANNLFIAGIGGNLTITADPTNYGSSAEAGTPGTAVTRRAVRQLAASSDNPSVFNNGATGRWCANTIVIKPLP